jgi:DNA-binding MarR family transcriptional regulator
MSSPTPRKNLGVLLRDPFVSGNARLHEEFAARGHPEIRPVHGNVFPFLDDAGTRVSVLGERAQVTKQSMAELVAHLESHGYVERTPDPTDRRAKLVRATRRGRELYAIANAVSDEVEREWAQRLGRDKMRHLRALLEELNEVV